MRKVQRRKASSGKGPTVVSWKKEKKRRKRQQRFRKLRRLAGQLLTLAVLAAALVYLGPQIMEQGPAAEDLKGPYRVLWAADGDTLVIDIDGVETSVRLIGIDAPESVHWDETKNVPEGAESSEFLKGLIRGKKVWLEYDSELLDKYDRTLAYVWLDDGETMVQDLILKAGMAKTLTIRPNVRYTLRFEKLQFDAKREKAGLWAGSALDAAP